MSKGKQWWPLNATTEDYKKTIIEFQERLRDKQWLKKAEGNMLMYIYATEGQINTDNLTTVNDYMQISANDNTIKNQGRVIVLRLLAMLLKWHMSLKKELRLLDQPSVFTIPNLINGGFHYGIIATLEGDSIKNTKPTTIVISNIDISQSNSFKVKKWVMPQGSDSYKWLTIKSWLDLKSKISFNKWIFGNFAEKKLFLEKQIELNDKQKLEEVGLLEYSFNSEENHLTQGIKNLGAMYNSTTKKWYLPYFWEKENIEEYLKTIPEETKKYNYFFKNSNSNPPEPNPKDFEDIKE